MRQGDGLVPPLFNLVLEYVIRKTDIEATLLYKSLEVVVNVDDINILARMQLKDDEALTHIEEVV